MGGRRGESNSVTQHRNLRGGSRPASSLSNTCSSSKKQTAKINHPSSSSPSCNQGRRLSRARKALNFDNHPPLPAASSSSFAAPFDETASFPPGEEDRGASSSCPTPGDESFWSNPPPPADGNLPSLSLFGHFPEIGQPVQTHRRSQRLIYRKSSAEETSVVGVDISDDSGLEPTPPSSQQLFPNTVWSSVAPEGRSLSVTSSSDYGSISEESFGGQQVSGIKRKARFGASREPPVKRSARRLQGKGYALSQDLSPGYLSDIETGVHSSLPPLPEPWDDPGQDSPSDDVLLVLDESGILMDETHQSTPSTSYLNISHLSAVEDVGVKWLSHNGVHVVIPLEGIQLPTQRSRDVECKPKTEASNTTDAESPRRRRRSRALAPLPPPCPFQIKTTNRISGIQESFLRQGMRIIGASEVVRLEPLGTKFCSLYPAIVSIPLLELPGSGDQVHCLYSSDPEEDPWDSSHDPTLTWTPLQDQKITLEDGRLTFETFEFSSFVVVIRERGIEAVKQIRTRIGGKLIVPEVPWIQIEFPRGSLKEDITAKAHVFLDTEKSLPEYIQWRRQELEISGFLPSLALASPTVMLEPHGFNFLPDLVTVELPIPNYEEIQATFGPSARLVIWQSCTGEKEGTDWEILHVTPTLRKVKHLGSQVQTVASFRVAHFSFFRIVWDLISESLYEARVGMSYFHSFVSFSMKCQANMEEARDEKGSRFGLEVTCFRSDKKLPENTNYRYRVGASSKPKLVRPGKIFVRLKSSYFDADVDAGEDPELMKEEADFRGRDFEVQYCCRFKPDKSIDRGPFGKVIVNRHKPGKQEEMLFEFNLQKSGHEGEKTPGNSEDRWSILALQELASGLFILDGENWKVFASHIGFTKQEVRQHFKNSPNAFLSIVNMYQNRGGTPDEFVQALYTVNRELKINGLVSPSSTSRKSRSSTGSSGRGSMTYCDNFKTHNNVLGGSIGSDSDTSGTHISQDSGLALAGPSKKRSNPSVNRSNGSSSKAKRSRKRSPEEENDGDHESSDSLKVSGSDEGSDLDVGTTDIRSLLEGTAKSEGNASSIVRRNDATKLESSYLWEISAHLESGINWKSLGRTLWLEEPILINIEVGHRLSGMRELFYQVLISWREKHPKRCTFGILYAALRKEGMNAAAKAMMTIKRNN